jgi:hypothetical protein
MVRHQLKVFATMFLLLYAITASGQSSQQGVVLIRNVRVADGEGNPLVAADVLVVGGHTSRVRAGTPTPAGAIVIDGGGNQLTLRADGQIMLTPVGSQSEATQPQVRYAQGQQVALAKEVPTTDSVIPPESNSLKATSQQADSQGEENLAAQVVDPSSPLTTVTFQNKFSPSLWGVDDKQNEIDTQVAVPLKLLGKRNILRITIPYLTSTPTGNRGLADTSLFDIFLFPKKWGTGVAGFVASFGVNKGPGVDTFAIGPAVGAVFKKEKWTYGVFNQNLFSADDVATTQIQPILAYTFSKKVSVAFGDQQFTYDWHKDRFVLVPVGFQLNYIAMLGKQPVRFLIGPQYNIKNELGAKKWTITTGFALILR